MSQRFNPRYIFKHTRSESTVISMTGVRAAKDAREAVAA